MAAQLSQQLSYRNHMAEFRAPPPVYVGCQELPFRNHCGTRRGVGHGSVEVAYLTRLAKMARSFVHERQLGAFGPSMFGVGQSRAQAVPRPI